jgi:hypothetical protein
MANCKWYRNRPEWKLFRSRVVRQLPAGLSKKVGGVRIHPRDKVNDFRVGIFPTRRKWASWLWVIYRQGNQIGRIFAHWVIVYFGLCIENYRSSPIFWIPVKVTHKFWQKWVGPHFGWFFHKLIWSPCEKALLPLCPFQKLSQNSSIK